MEVEKRKSSEIIEDLSRKVLLELERCFEDLDGCDDRLKKCAKIMRTLDVACKMLVKKTEVHEEEVRIENQNAPQEDNSEDSIVNRVILLQGTLNHYDNTLPKDHPAREFIGFQRRDGTKSPYSILHNQSLDST